jgi:hypothetical protein
MAWTRLCQAGPLARACEVLWNGRERLAAWGVVVALAGTLVVGVKWEAWIASGADAFGYLSQAGDWMRGELRVPQPLIKIATWPRSEWTASPLGYKPATIPGAIVPNYPPGLPLAMAAAATIGGRSAIFWVLPLAGLAVVWLTYVLGRWIDSAATGAIAAIIVASSPIFVRQMVVPMSDVATTAWWLGAIALVAKRRPAFAGACAAAALLTRPNLTPLAAWLALGIVIGELERGTPSRRIVRLLLAYSIPAAAGLGFILWLNNYLYGNPLTSGYGPARYLFAAAHIPDNLILYPRWLLETQTIFPFVGLFAPAFLWFATHNRWGAESTLRPGPVAIALGAFLIVFCCYLPYLVFADWTYLRFLLPVLPLLVVLSVGVSVGIIRRLPVSARVPVLGLIVVAVVAYQLGPGGTSEVRNLRTIESRYEVAGLAAGRILPERAVFLSMQESGSLRYYSGRETVRFDELLPNWLDRAVVALRDAGYHPYFALESSEEDRFRARFGELNEFGRLDWAPYLEIRTAVVVRFYDPLMRQRGVGARGATLVLTEDFKPRR